MLRPSSFTFSFERIRSNRRLNRKQLQRHIRNILLWTIGALILLDIAVGLTFRPPVGPDRTLSSLQRYFEYGRSIEGKLRRLVGSTPEQDAVMVKAGWLSDCDIGTTGSPGKLTLDVYGMSFSRHIADEMVSLDSKLAVQNFGGPGAPPNHSYACFVRRTEANLERAPVQILGILASSVPRMETIGGLTTSFEFPEPFTYPRYSLPSDGRLLGYSSSIANREELRTALANPGKWRDFVDEFATHDAFYAPWVFNADVFDYSVLGRMIRRAWGQRVLRARTAALRPEEGYSGAPDIERVLPTILIDFAARALTAGERPIIILIEDWGYGGTLSRIAEPTLRAHHIDFLRTSAIVSPNDAANFLADGHFTHAANQKIARAVLDALGRAGLNGPEN